MHLLRRCLLAFFLLFAVPLAAAPSGSDWLYHGSDIPRDPAWQFGTLPNGLRYAVRRNALPAGQVSIRVRIDAGSLNEQDNEQGWAHFVEHLAFRGTKSFEDREARHIWEQLGAGFGSDTNASTSATQTVYQLDLPKNDRASLEQSFSILAEMMDSARFDPAAVDGERKIVLAEKAGRSELSVRRSKISRPLFFAGLKIANRDPIGIDQTLAAATANGLRAFYERWYRPDRTTVVVVGDADPALLTELLTRHFAGWRPTGPPPKALDYGTIAEPREKAVDLAYPGAPLQLQLVWLRPGYKEPNTIAQHRVNLTEQLALTIINRRFEAKARKQAAFLGAGVSGGNDWRTADTTTLGISPRESGWREALTESFAILADALRTPPSTSEMARELSNMRTGAQVAIDTESTIRSQQWAQRMVGTVDGEGVVTPAAEAFKLFERLAPQITPAMLQETTQRLLGGKGPRLMLVGPTEIEGGEATLAAALAIAERAVPAARAADRIVTFDSLPRLGPPGKEVSRQRIADMDVTIVRFANGSTLTFRRNEFQKGSVAVQLRFGNGLAGLSPKQISPVTFAGVIGSTGLGDLDLDAMEILTTGRRLGLGFGMAEDSFLFSASTDAKDLSDQLRLFALKLAYPRWDDVPFNLVKSFALEAYDLTFKSASGRALRERGGLMHVDDTRWMPMEKEAMAKTQPADVWRFFGPLLQTGPIQAIVVGDADLEPTVAAFAATVGALPSRPDPGPINQPSAPRADPKPRTFTHSGDPNQAYVLIGWTTMGRAAPMQDRRALSLAAAILRTRLFERLREGEGATYSPGATSNSSETFPGWGVFTAEAQVKPESVDAFFRIARETVADLAKRPLPAEEFTRAQNPVMSGIERDIKSNGYWLGRLADWPIRPELIEQTRNHLSDYKGLTPEAVRAAVAAYVADEGDWSMLVLPEKAKANGD